MIKTKRKITTIKKDRFIVEMPTDVEIHVSVGQRVTKNTALYTEDIAVILETHYLPKSLGIKASQSADYIGRVSGQLVQKEDLLAERLTGGGLMTKRIIAGTDGILSTRRLNLGYIDILGEAESKDVFSPVRGKITNVQLGKHIEIESDSLSVDYFRSAHLEKAAHHVDSLSGEYVVGGFVETLFTKKMIDSVGEDTAGTHDVGGKSGIFKSVKIQKDIQKMQTKEISLISNVEDTDFANKIVYVGNYLYPELAKELYKRQATAIITNGIDYDDFDRLEIPIIVLNGFGLQSGRENGSFENIVDLMTKFGEKFFIEIDTDSRQLHVFGLSKKVKTELNVDEDDSGIEFVKIDPRTNKSSKRISSFYEFRSEVKVGDIVRSIEPENFGLTGFVKEIQTATDGVNKNKATENLESGIENGFILIVQRENGSYFITESTAVEIMV